MDEDVIDVATLTQAQWESDAAFADYLAGVDAELGVDARAGVSKANAQVVFRGWSKIPSPVTRIFRTSAARQRGFTRTAYRFQQPVRR